MTTKLSYGNMWFSGTCPAETPQPIKMKLCTIDNVGKVTRCAKKSWNRLYGGGPTDRWNITSKTLLTILYLTFFYCKPLQPKRLNRSARTMAQTTRFAVRKCLLGVAIIRNCISKSKSPKAKIAQGSFRLILKLAYASHLFQMLTTLAL
jgi:hypothetical protein